MDLKAKADGACAVMLEMIQGEGGVLPLSKEFVKGVETFCKENDIDVIVFDMNKSGNIKQIMIDPSIGTIVSNK